MIRWTILFGLFVLAGFAGLLPTPPRDKVYLITEPLNPSVITVDNNDHFYNGWQGEVHQIEYQPAWEVAQGY